MMVGVALLVWGVAFGATGLAWAVVWYVVRRRSQRDAWRLAQMVHGNVVAGGAAAASSRPSLDDAREVAQRHGMAVVTWQDMRGMLESAGYRVLDRRQWSELVGVVEGTGYDVQAFLRKLGLEGD